VALPVVIKTFPLELDDLAERAHEWERSWLALDGELPVGVIATQEERWNRRVIVWHLYVSASHRKQGIGRRLLEVALETAHAAGALTAWLETSNINVPGIRAYERLGFELCGLDTSLYEGTAAEGEVALFLSRSL
jgi:ribosomal protein S18 acetylase RimI-like enzyme